MTPTDPTYRPRYQYAPATPEDVKAALRKHRLKIIGYHDPKKGEWFLGKCNLVPYQWGYDRPAWFPCIIVERINK